MVIDETVKESLYRAISVLVSASPCALAISTPSAVLSAVARAAKGGVLIKGGRALEDLGSLATIAFDKTGTLTEGKPKLTNLIVFNECNKNIFLDIVADVESLSNHPLAKAIVKDIKAKYDVEGKNKTVNIQEIQGKGLKAMYGEQEVFIGNKELMADQNISISVEAEIKLQEVLQNGHTTILVAFNNELIGLLSVMDVPRESAKSTLSRLKTIGIKKK